MRQELFRCDHCYELHPLERKQEVIYQPIPTSSIAAQASAQQGRRMHVMLLDSTCAECYRNEADIRERYRVPRSL